MALLAPDRERVGGLSRGKKNVPGELCSQRSIAGRHFGSQAAGCPPLRVGWSFTDLLSEVERQDGIGDRHRGRLARVEEHSRKGRGIVEIAGPVAGVLDDGFAISYFERLWRDECNDNLADSTSGSAWITNRPVEGGIDIVVDRPFSIDLSVERKKERRGQRVGSASRGAPIDTIVANGEGYRFFLLGKAFDDTQNFTGGAIVVPHQDELTEKELELSIVGLSGGVPSTSIVRRRVADIDGPP